MECTSWVVHVNTGNRASRVMTCLSYKLLNYEFSFRFLFQYLIFFVVFFNFLSFPWVSVTSAPLYVTCDLTPTCACSDESLHLSDSCIYLFINYYIKTYRFVFPNRRHCLSSSLGDNGGLKVGHRKFSGSIIAESGWDNWTAALRCPKHPAPVESAGQTLVYLVTLWKVSNL